MLYSEGRCLDNGAQNAIVNCQHTSGTRLGKGIQDFLIGTIGNSLDPTCLVYTAQMRQDHSTAAPEPETALIFLQIIDW